MPLSVADAIGQQRGIRRDRQLELLREQLVKPPMLGGDEPGGGEIAIVERCEDHRHVGAQAVERALETYGYNRRQT